MNSSVKKIFKQLPRPLKRFFLRAYEDYYRNLSLKETGTVIRNHSRHAKHSKPRVLFYFVSGLSYGGVAKMMQIFAKHLNHDKYEVYFMYSAKHRDISGGGLSEDARKFYLQDTPVHLVEHGYDSMDGKYPYIIRNMQPSLPDVLEKNEIDLLVTTGSGYSEFPFNMETDLPIFHFNIFGSPAVQKNIRWHLCISKEVVDRISDVVLSENIEVMYIPSEPPPTQAAEWGRDLRNKLGYKDNDVVFGRIGRAVDGIFDPIGIRAFQRIVDKHPNAYYLIMSPPPILEKIVKEEKIPNVRFLPSSGREEDIWGFHQAIDVMAHFRHDGESFGLNIAESMLCGKPIISHKSHFWNAHLEYLDNTFSRVAEVDNVDQYASFMEYFIGLPESERRRMGDISRQKADKNFLIENNISRFEKLIDQAVNPKGK